LNTEWTELEVIDLLNDGSGLGFGIVGSKSTGVWSAPSSLAAPPTGTAGFAPAITSSASARCAPRHGQRARRQPPAPVQRPGAPHCCPRRPDAASHSPTAEPGRLCQLTPTAELDAHLADLLATMQPQLNDEEAMAEAEQQDSRTQTSWPQNCLEQFHKPPQLSNSRNSAEENSEEDFENEEEKHFTVLLNRHGSRGLGITIAGYSKLSGIFIKSILSGSEADIQGRLAMNDRIVK
uniref:PDZ domain-containing protein n=1 Tax=Macrostomum lignano TaxID=282301 RepID=A0A1I8FLW6_9PLAT